MYKPTSREEHHCKFLLTNLELGFEVTLEVPVVIYNIYKSWFAMSTLAMKFSRRKIFTPTYFHICRRMWGWLSGITCLGWQTFIGSNNPPPYVLTPLMRKVSRHSILLVWGDHLYWELVLTSKIQTNIELASAKFYFDFTLSEKRNWWSPRRVHVLPDEFHLDKQLFSHSPTTYACWGSALFDSGIRISCIADNYQCKVWLELDLLSFSWTLNPFTYRLRNDSLWLR